MVTSWSSDISTYTYGAQAIAKQVSQLSGDRLVIETYPAGVLAGAFDGLDAVSTGKAECGHGRI
jgi:TRAP-type mannitol/chloroaromatic compound transport system substrate-binding protein